MRSLNPRAFNLLDSSDTTTPGYSILSHRWQDEQHTHQQTGHRAATVMDACKPEPQDSSSQPIPYATWTALKDTTTVMLATILGWTGSAIAHRYARQRAEAQSLLLRNTLLSTVAEEQERPWYPPWQSCLFDKAVSMINRPSSQFSVLACTIYACSLLYLAFQQRHWYHRNSVRVCLIMAAVIACIVLEDTEYIMIEVVYRYIPISALIAEVLSLCVGRARRRTCRIESDGCDSTWREKDTETEKL